MAQEKGRDCFSKPNQTLTGRTGEVNCVTESIHMLIDWPGCFFIRRQTSFDVKKDLSAWHGYTSRGKRGQYSRFLLSPADFSRSLIVFLHIGIMLCQELPMCYQCEHTETKQV